MHLVVLVHICGKITYLSKMKNILLCILLISVSCSIINCSGSKKIGKEDYLCLFPSDSTLLTETQLNQKTEITRFIRDKIILEEKSVRLQYKKKELRDYNFPKQYIKWINNDINNFNAFIETSNDAEQLLNELRDNINILY